MSIARMRQNKFSIVTPNYNMGSYLAETIESVLRNLQEGDEYYIVDGGSTDNSVDIIRQYETRLSGWVSESDKGYADALSKGFCQTQGEFQCWLNSGDILLEGALDVARRKFQDASIDMIYGDDLYIDDHGKILQVSNGKVDRLNHMMLFGGWTPLQDACFWRRALYEKVGGVDPMQRYAADYDLFLRMSLAGVAQYVPAIFSAFRQHEGQTSQRFARAYRQEREVCRERELSLAGVTLSGRFWKESRYWTLVRWRARFQACNKKMQHLIGQDVRQVGCQTSCL